MKRGIKAGPPFCVAPVPMDEPYQGFGDEHECLGFSVPQAHRMSLEELNKIDDNIRQGYRWGCEMRALADEVRYYLEVSTY
jgi:hypothetical protein